MREKPSNEFERFDEAVSSLLSVPYKDLQAQLKEEKQAKQAAKKRRPISSARASSARKKRVA